MRPRAVFVVAVLFAAAATIGAGRPAPAGRGRPFTFGTFIVNSNADDDDGLCQQPPGGDCTLREAINASNATMVTRFANEIKFAIGTGVAVIAENTSLPAVTRAVAIDGTTQPGPSTASCFTELGHPCIELRGPASNSGVFGLTLDSSATVEALAVNGFTEGIYIDVHGGVLVEDSRVGTAADGSLAGIHDGNFVGVRVRPTQLAVTIGAPGHGNLLSNNSGAAIGLEPSGAQCYGTAHVAIQANRIGTNGAGTSALPNTANGITIFDSTNVTVGGTAAGTGNVISGNVDQGVSVFEGSLTGCGAVPSANVAIQGNLIGTNGAGTAAIPNGTAANQLLDPSGVLIDATGVTVGGSSAAARNVISGNSAAGIQFGSNASGSVSGSSDTIQGNFIGTTAAGTAAVGNTVGILVEGPSSGNTIGGPLQGSPGGSAGNLISGNVTGIRVLGGSASGNLIRGNFVGTNAAGTGVLPNVVGVVVDGASSTTVDQDVASGNLQDGVVITGGATSTSVTGSFLGVEVDGATALTNHGSGVRLDGAGTGTVIGGSGAGDGNVLSGNVQAGLVVVGTTGAVVEGNMIGVDGAGTTAVPNTQSGVLIFDASGNTIGGGGIGGGNVVSGNGVGFTAGPGIDIVEQTPGATSGNVVVGNVVGTDPTGTTAIPNATGGVAVQGGSGNTIGGTTPGLGNLLSGNGGPGVDLRGGTSDNLVQGNLIGTDAAGSSAVPNGDGVRVIEGSTGNVVGGTSAAARNVISGNVGNGVILQDDGTTSNLVQGNFIGTDEGGGAALGNGLNGVSLLASGNTIGGTSAGAGNVISGNARGIAGADLTGDLIAGNRIGTTADGTAALGNSDVGIRLDDSTGVTVGGSVPAARNVISGNGGNGLELNGGGQHLVRGNRIGTNAAGTAAVPNTGNGIDVAGSAANRIGGGAKTRNLISGNGIAGVFVHDPGSTGNKVAANFLGTDAKGTAALGNAKAGVQILDASGNTIGGPTKAAGNRIEFNGGRGVVIDDPNDPATGNAVRRDLMSHNGALGIDLGADGPDPNDAHDADAGPNGRQNFPVIHVASTAGGRTEIRLTLSSTARTAFVVELFSNTACDPSGFGEAQAFVVSKTITTAADGTASLAFSRHPAVPVGRFLTATATDPSGNTSEFSHCAKVTAG